MAVRILSRLAFCAIVFGNCLALPSVVPSANKRVQRSPQFGFPSEELVAPGYQAPGPILGGPAFPIQEPLPEALYPQYGAYPEGGGDSFASANAGSFGNGGGPSEAQSQANSQSATINFGPLSASFSNSESSAGSSSF